MEWYWWVLIAGVVVFIGYQALITVLGHKQTPGDAAVFFLSAQLKELGVRQIVPNRMVQELSAQIVEGWTGLAKVKGDGPTWIKTEMIPEIQNTARNIALWLQGNDEANTHFTVPKAMAKYGIPFGAAAQKRAQ